MGEFGGQTSSPKLENDGFQNPGSGHAVPFLRHPNIHFPLHLTFHCIPDTLFLGPRNRIGSTGHRDRPLRILSDRDTDRKSTRLNSSHLVISYAVFCLKKKKTINSVVVYKTASSTS